jgi:hypothetical protein
VTPIREAGRILARARARRDSLPVEQAAAEAYVPGGPSVDELADRIRALRGHNPGRKAAA